MIQHLVAFYLQGIPSENGVCPVWEERDVPPSSAACQCHVSRTVSLSMFESDRTTEFRSQTDIVDPHEQAMTVPKFRCPPGMPTPCRLTGIALGSTQPTLRLQFEECDGRGLRDVWRHCINSCQKRDLTSYALRFWILHVQCILNRLWLRISMSQQTNSHYLTLASRMRGSLITPDVHQAKQQWL